MGKAVRRIGVAIICIVLLLPAGARADGTDYLKVRGHILDPYGDPVDVCVNASPADKQDAFLVTVFPDRGAISSASDGSYEFDAIPGDTNFHVWTSDHNTYGDNGNYCPYRNRTPNFQDYESAERDIDTREEQGRFVDVMVRYQLGGGVWGPLCCIKSAGRPRDSMEIYAELLKRAADHGLHIVWRDETSGTEIDVPRIANFWKESLSPPRTGYENYFTIPADRPDGTYRSWYSAVDPNGVDVASGGYVDTTVDSVPPVMLQMFPADGDVVPSTLGTWVRATDDRAGTAPFWTRATIYDMSSGTPVRVAAPFRYPQRSGDAILLDTFTLKDDTAYRAVFHLADYANNTVERTVEFRTGAPNVFTDLEPTGTVTSPAARIGVTVADNINIDLTHIYVYRDDLRVGARWEWTLHRDGRHVWIQPGELPDGPPELVDGTYRVDAIGYDYGYNQYSLSWSFDVRREAPQPAAAQPRATGSLPTAAPSRNAPHA
ncbi:MAG: hypothetical protein ABR548_08235 [Actinomycetota bacterium]|nr:hypothetical protein [Actinomycetota bacterium]